MRKLKTAMIGAFGHQGYLLAAAQNSADRLSIAAVARSRPGEALDSLLGALADAGMTPRVHDDWRRMLDDEQPDLVSVAPMFCDHQKMAVECLRRGIHVICEKPVAMHLDELDELESVYAAGSAAFTGMHAMRYQPNFHAGYRALQSGLIGRPILINSQKSYAFDLSRPPFYREREQYGGTLCWVAIHAIDWTYWMAGPFEQMHAVQTTLGNKGYGSCESAGALAFTFEGGGVGCIHFDFLKAYRDVLPQDRCRIAGEKGVIEIGENRAWVVTHEESRRELELEIPRGFVESFIDTIDGRPGALLTARDTFEVTRLALRARDLADRAG